MRRFRLFLNILILFVLVCTMPGQTREQDKDLSYEVNVNAQLVPVYAVDKKGNPVFDLKKNEIMLYADGKRTDVIYFNGYRVEEQQQINAAKVPGRPAAKKTGTAALKSPARLNFIIIDSLVSNLNVLNLGRTIATGIIKNAPPGDAFIIMESNQVRGFQYIAGPEKDPEKLALALARIEKLYQSRRFYLDPGTLHELEVVKGTPAETIVMSVLMMDNDIVTDNRRSYRRDIRVLAQSIQQLKYALKTISLPKTVFLITANPQKFQLGRLESTRSVSVPATYYRFLENAAKAVNMGGSMFYLINPLMYRSKQKRTELKFMTDAGYGKLIHGTSIEEIVEKVKKSTSAYYEMAFYPDKKPGEKTRIKLKCKRKGVELISIGYSEQARPYREMNDTEKKLFALDIVNRGNWSRITAKVGRIKYRELPGTGSDSPAKTIRINIPPFMRNRPLEVVTVHINPKTQEAAVERKIKTMDAIGTLQITPIPGRDSYFIIIEPKTPLCIYNKVEFETDGNG